MPLGEGPGRGSPRGSRPGRSCTARPAGGARPVGPDPRAVGPCGGGGTFSCTTSTTASEICNLPGGGTSVVDVCSTPAGCSCPAGTAKVTVGTATTGTITTTVGPGTIQTRPCKSQTFFVAAGTTNINTNTHTTTTFACALVPTPDLTVAKTHAAGFVKGQTGSYTITVSNVGTGPTAGTVTVTDSLPTGLTVTAMSGTGWTCTAATATCTRGDALAAGASYPPITLTVSIAATADSLTNVVTVSGGGDVNAANNTASDPTTVAAATIPTLSVYAQAIVVLVILLTGLVMLRRLRPAPGRSR